MQDQTATRTRPASRTTVRDELLAPPRPSRRAQFSVVAFGLLLVASLVIPAVTDTAPVPGLSLVFAGMMILLGFAELLDASKRRFVIGLRVGGTAMALLGFAIQLAAAIG